VLHTKFDFASLRAAMRGGAGPQDIVREAYRRIRADARDDVWITLRPEQDALDIARRLEERGTANLPLYGIPFSVKDNIDVAGLPTTAGCPAFAYLPERSARVVAALEDKGAICIGKVNLDQFATGLNGTRSPYGACGSAFDRTMVAGGSSSGSAVSVALQQVAFSIGTDTGGSGRIPAGLNNVIGLKPTRGTLSTDGLVVNCHSLDCPSVFSLAIEDASEIAAQMFDPASQDATLRDDAARGRFAVEAPAGAPEIIVPEPHQREFFGNAAGRQLYEQAIEAFAALGASVRVIDFDPFVEAGTLVFNGPWIADRYAAVGPFVDTHEGEVMEITRTIVQTGKNWTGADIFRSMMRLREINGYVRSQFGSKTVLVLPTVAPLYSIKEMLAEPAMRNTHHGHYSYFANLVDLCAVAVPSGFYSSGMPFGITLFAPAFSDSRLAGLSDLFLRSRALIPGKGRRP